ncbi:hypothetical protein Y032_0007g3436 [Ancylostoma ceylanicum]|uniref:Uncharacterized protein n=1 Tax=Ancylostoma ceylanicum TaxID=53326 RepID=A0A016VMG0_9BILA|nr:hypothetical protein Y032_0007g3436 [Ancylostoma ceylanicum]
MDMLQGIIKKIIKPFNLHAHRMKRTILYKSGLAPAEMILERCRIHLEDTRTGITPKLTTCHSPHVNIKASKIAIY